MRIGRILFLSLALCLSLSAHAETVPPQPKIDRPINIREAIQLVKSAEPGGIPIVMTSAALDWLNRDAGSRAGRRSMRAAIVRMKLLEPMLRTKLLVANMPLELMAVPIVESGYQDVTSGQASGIWQMMPETARSLGLWVNILIDERHNAERLTDAAIAQYAELYRHFGNWHLALLAYNAGAGRIDEVIRRAGHADAFRLLEERVLSEVRVNYMGRLMSTMLILKHPELLND